MEEVSASSESIYFASPLKSKKNKPGLFDSHPPISSRIERLENM